MLTDKQDAYAKKIMSNFVKIFYYVATDSLIISLLYT